MLMPSRAAASIQLLAIASWAARSVIRPSQTA
jgi:hypothetical protein